MLLINEYLQLGRRLWTTLFQTFNALFHTDMGNAKLERNGHVKGQFPNMVGLRGRGFVKR